MSANLLAMHFGDSRNGEDRIVRRTDCRVPIRKGYLICITPRSGSTYLTHLLAENRLFGCPHEWFNFDIHPHKWFGCNDLSSYLAAHGIHGFSQYLEHIWTKTSSTNGVFGLQLSHPQYRFLQEMTPLEGVLGSGFDWFYLTRGNIVAQAISLYLAHETGIYHRYKGDVEHPGAEAVAYDEVEITRLIGMVVDQENAFERLFRARGVEPVRLRYEDMINDKESVIRLFGRVLGIGEDLQATDTDSVLAMAGETNIEFESRYRSTRSAFIKEVLSRRHFSDGKTDGRHS